MTIPAVMETPNSEDETLNQSCVVWTGTSSLYRTINSTPYLLLRCATNRKVAGSIPAVIIGVFIDIKSFRSHYGPGVDSAYNRNVYQEHFLGGKGGRCVRLTTLPQSCAVDTKSRNLNFLEPSGPLRA